ncbi:MAG: ATP synthase F1 subunit gamma [Deltaproteobacteria bacterium]|nr:MAG: ATP synthase F1 subunit gamma [Deltaproteobacteria bacterium]
MAQLKEIKLRISGIKKTKQITNAMKMVATSRLRGTQLRMEAFRPYAEKFSEVLGSLASRAGEDLDVPLLKAKEAVKRIHVILMTSDRGLCGGFNANLIEQAEAFLTSLEDRDVEVSFSAFGKKGRDWCRKEEMALDAEYVGVVGTKLDFGIASTTAQTLIGRFLEDTYDEVYVIYSHFVSMGKQVPTLAQLLPIPPIEASDAEENDITGYQAEHICEPSPVQLMNDLLPRSIAIQVFNALLETSTSEHAARMSAMDNATKACNDMVKELQRLFNKARQAAITSDLMDIVGGAEALKG